MEPQEKILTVDDNGKIQTSIESLSSPLEYQGVLKKPPSTSVHGMRTIKSLSG
jgi:predicted RNA-binding protein with RPS1 domain